MDLTARIRLDPAELPDPVSLATDDDLRRAAEALAPAAHRRAAADAAASAWKVRTDALRAAGGRPHHGEGQRAAFVDRLVARSMADAGERAAVVAAIEAQLRGLCAGGPGAD